MHEVNRQNPVTLDDANILHVHAVCHAVEARRPHAEARGRMRQKK